MVNYGRAWRKRSSHHRQRRLGNGHTECLGTKIVILDEYGLANPGHPGVLEAAYKLLFLRINADDGQPLSGEALAHFSDMRELRITLRREVLESFL